MKRNLFIAAAVLLGLIVMLSAGAGVAYAGTIEVTAPAVGDTLLSGATYEIKWTTDVPSLSGATIYFSSDGGANWTKQGVQDYSKQSYTWTVPSTTTNQARIRVEVSETVMSGGMPPSISTKYYKDDTGDFTISKMALLPIKPGFPIKTKPTAPSNLTASNSGPASVDLSWMDNSSNETGFFVHRKLEGAAGYTSIGSVGENVSSYTDTGLADGTTYYYVVTAYNSVGSSAFSNESIFMTAQTLVTKPNAPTLKTATVASNTQIDLGWTDNADNETGVNIYRKAEGEAAFTKVDTIAADWTGYGDAGLTPGTKYYYYIEAFNTAGSSASNQLNATTTGAPAVVIPNTPPQPDTSTPPASSKSTVLRFYIDNNQYYINDIATPMDTSPVVKDGRTLLPVRYVATPLGATVDWDPATKKVTVSNNGTVIELWVNKNTARVNGVEKLIDPANSTVSPIIMPPGRTMLPLRFIAENLGCQVEWNGVSREAKVTYVKP